jgi:hypothetical protein
MIYIFKFRKSFSEFEFLILKPLDHRWTTNKIDQGHRQTTIKPPPDHHQATPGPPPSHLQTITESPPNHYRATPGPPSSHIEPSLSHHQEITGPLSYNRQTIILY